MRRLDYRDDAPRLPMKLGQCGRMGLRPEIRPQNSKHIFIEVAWQGGRALLA
jgi:hypothetical protein